MGKIIFKPISNAGIINSKSRTVYDIELDKNHYFIANGFVTHNCRLKNKIQTKEFNFTNGNIGVNCFGLLYA